MRYLPHTTDSRAAMLRAIGAERVDDLFRGVPEKAFIQGKANLPDHLGEIDVERRIGSFAAKNHAAPDGPFFLGAGTYFHHIPASVDYIIQRSEFLTAYTPYQPEIAQGTLQAIYEFQSFIALLTGQDVANASMYDGATSCAEAALMAQRVTGRRKIVVGNALHPNYLAVLKTYMSNFDDVEIGDPHPSFADAQDTLSQREREGARDSGKGEGIIDQQTACVIVQSPDFYGEPQGYEYWRKICDETGALLIVVINEILSLGLLPAPIEADIVCGEAQSIGLPMSFGGPHLGFFACREKYLRQMPGRLCGMTEDQDGRRGFVLTLSTREQHIRREKATSNICTNQGLCALAFTVHMSLLGESGFKRLALLNHEAAIRTARALDGIPNVKRKVSKFFNEFTLELGRDAEPVVEALARQGIIAGYPEGRNLIVAATEMTRDEDIERLADAMKKVLT